jgi:hypothetical protein
MEETQIIKLWKELGVDYVNFEFSCGGDSMNDTSIQIYNESGEEIECDEIRDYIDDKIYNEVEFYVNSDGHYQGESGNVAIRLSDDEDEEELTYSKSSQSEWSERLESVCRVKLDDKTIQFIKDKVLNINGDMDNMSLNYKTDCILTDEEEKIVDELERDLIDTLRNHEPEEECQGELNEWFNFTTNEEGEEIVIEDNCLCVNMSIEMTVYVED